MGHATAGSYIQVFPIGFRNPVTGATIAGLGDAGILATRLYLLH